MSTANVKQVMHHVGAGDVIRNHGQTVGLVGTGSRGNLLPADDALRS